MEPIINPWIIYLIDLCGTLKPLLCILVVLATVALIADIVVVLDSHDRKKIDAAEIKKLLLCCNPRILSAYSLIVIMTILIPSKETMYVMLLLNEVTYDRVELLGDQAIKTYEVLKGDMRQLLELNLPDTLKEVEPEAE